MPLAQLTSRQPPRSPQPQKGFLTGPEPRPLPGLRYQGNFSISRLSLQIRPLAEENKGLFMGSRAHLLLLHCVFYALSLKAFFTDKSPCLRPYRWHQRKAQKVKWFNEGRWKCQSRTEKGTKEGLPAPRSTTCPLLGAPPAHSQAWLSAPEVLSAPPTPASVQIPFSFETCSSRLPNQERRSLERRSHLAKSIEGQWTCQDPKESEWGLWAPEEVICRRQA